MTRVQKTVLWSIAVCVLGLFCVRALIARAPAAILARSPATVAELAVDGTIVTYPFNAPGFQNDARRLQEQFAGRANILLDSRPDDAGVSYLYVHAPENVQDEIRGIVNFLTKRRTKATSDSAGTPPGADAQPPVHAADQEAVTAPKTSNQAGLVVTYGLQYVPVGDVAKVIESQFAGRIGPIVQQNGNLLVQADLETQTELRGLINYLDKPGSTGSASAGDVGPGSMRMTAPQQQSTQYGYPGQSQQQQQGAQERILAARRTLIGAKTDVEKKAARGQLRQLLADIFVQDMRMREKQAAEIEVRLSKLRKQYQDRESAKERIIDLQLKVIEADGAGLGFPDGNASRTPPPSSTRDPADPFGNGKQVGSPTPEDPMIGSGSPGQNKPPTRVNQHDPKATERTLEEVKKIHGADVAALKERGHFIESTDGKLYAYANRNWPSGPSVIRVVDSVTGKLVATATITEAGPLVFTDEGVATRENFGAPILRVPLNKGLDGTNVSPKFDSGSALNPFDKPYPGTAGRILTTPVPTLHADFTSEYKELRNQYRDAKASLALHETQFNSRVAATQKSRPEMTLDDVKKRDSAAWRAVERAQSDFETANRLLETKLELLILDRKAATLALDGAEAKLQELSELQKKNTAPMSEVNQQRAALESAKLNVERISRLIDLFQSIKSEPVPGSEAPPAGAASGSDGSDDPVTSENRAP